MDQPREVYANESGDADEVILNPKDTYTKPADRLGIPSLMVSDGPHGPRKQDERADHLGINASIPAVCLRHCRRLRPRPAEAIGDAYQHERLAAERILTVHRRYLDNAKPDTPWDKDAHHELARKLAAECMMLLKMATTSCR